MTDKSHTDAVNGMVFSSSNDTLYSSSFDGTIRAWKFGDISEKICTFDCGVFSIDVMNEDIIIAGLASGRIEIRSKPCKLLLEGHKDMVTTLKCIPREYPKTSFDLLSCSRDGTARLWHINMTSQSSTCRHVFRVPGAPTPLYVVNLVRSFTFDESGFAIPKSNIVCAGRCGSFFWWDADTGMFERKSEAHDGCVFQLTRGSEAEGAAVVIDEEEKKQPHHVLYSCAADEKVISWKLQSYLMPRTCRSCGLDMIRHVDEEEDNILGWSSSMWRFCMCARDAARNAARNAIEAARFALCGVNAYVKACEMSSNAAQVSAFALKEIENVLCDMNVVLMSCRASQVASAASSSALSAYAKLCDVMSTLRRKKKTKKKLRPRKKKILLLPANTKTLATTRKRVGGGFSVLVSSRASGEVTTKKKKKKIKIRPKRRKLRWKRLVSGSVDSRNETESKTPPDLVVGTSTRHVVESDETKSCSTTTATTTTTIRTSTSIPRFKPRSLKPTSFLHPRTKMTTMMKKNKKKPKIILKKRRIPIHLRLSTKKLEHQAK